MARIKIEDLPVMEDIDAQETKGIFGGGIVINDKPGNRRGRRRGRFGRSAVRGGLSGFRQRGIDARDTDNLVRVKVKFPWLG